MYLAVVCMRQAPELRFLTSQGMPITSLAVGASFAAELISGRNRPSVLCAHYENVGPFNSLSVVR